MSMKVCIGRWDLLPKKWDGRNALYQKTGKELIAEATRQEMLIMGGEYHDDMDNFVGVLDLVAFEEEFNRYLDDGHAELSPTTHWIKFVDDKNHKLVGLKIKNEIDEIDDSI